MVAALCSLLFQCTKLTWGEPLDHLECFAGVAAITRGELEELQCENGKKRLESRVRARREGLLLRWT